MRTYSRGSRIEIGFPSASHSRQIGVTTLHFRSNPRILPCANHDIHGTRMLSDCRSLRIHQTAMNKMSSTTPNEDNSGIFKIRVKNFGPIESANVDLKPLTIFVGQSNTGKTYLATLIYALHQELGGFPRLPYSPKYYLIDTLRPLKSRNKNLQKSVKKFRDKFIKASQRPNINDLPFFFKEMLFSTSGQKALVQDNMFGNILATFGEKKLYSLCRNNGKSNTLSVKFGYSEQDKDIWHAEITSNKQKSSFQASQVREISVPSAITQQIANIIEQIEIGMDLEYPFYSGVESIIEALSYPKSLLPNSVHYLPAVRGGIMQSHRFVASAGLDRLLYTGLEDTRVIPRLPKTSIDFIKKLLSIGTNTPGLYRVRGSHRGRSRTGISSIADKFEELVLNGRVESHTEFTESYPEIYFKPSNIDSKFTLSRSSSMVSELAPIVLFIRHFVKQSDLLILEEPEAHLHPGAQVKIAQCLALLIRNGVNIIVTTHSDWFLKCVQKLLIQGELKKKHLDTHSDEIDSYLYQSEIGVWNFIGGTNNRGTKVEQIEFQEDTGVEPEEMEELAISLYNDVIFGRDLIASKEFSAKENRRNLCKSDAGEKEMFTPRDIATQLSVNVERIRRKLRQFGINPTLGQRYLFDRREFDNLCERLTSEFN